MDVNAFLSKGALREKFTLFNRVHVWALLVRLVALGPVSALDSFSFIIRGDLLNLLRFSCPYIIFELAEVNDCIS